MMFKAKYQIPSMRELVDALKNEYIVFGIGQKMQEITLYVSADGWAFERCNLSDDYPAVSARTHTIIGLDTFEINTVASRLIEKTREAALDAELEQI